MQIEFCSDYIIICVKRMQEEGIKALEVKERPVEKLYEHISTFSADVPLWSAGWKSRPTNF